MLRKSANEGCLPENQARNLPEGLDKRVLEKVRDPEIVRFEARDPHTMTSSARKAYTHQKHLLNDAAGVL